MKNYDLPRAKKVQPASSDPSCVEAITYKIPKFFSLTKLPMLLHFWAFSWIINFYINSFFLWNLKSFSIDCRKLSGVISFSSTAPCDWFKKTRAKFSTNETQNYNQQSRLFPRLAPVTRIYGGFLLVHYVV